MASVSSSGVRCASGTVATRSYRDRAKAVALSFLRWHPTGRFFILTADGPPSPEPIDGVVWLGPEDLQAPHVFELQLRYSPIELCCALKASLTRYAIECAGEELFLYLDADTVVYRPLGELWDALATAPALVLPHHVGSAASPERLAREQAVLPCGVYNAGCFAVRDTDEGRAFLRWWEDRIRYECRALPDQGIFYDQKWLDLARSVFRGIEVFRHPAYDVAYWNLFERPLTQGATGYEIEGSPLGVFHFSGLDVDSIRFVPFQPALHVDIPPGSPLRALVDEYVARLEALGRNETRRLTYAYPRFQNGVGSDHVFQTLYASLAREERAAFGDPFRTGQNSFFEWALSPSLSGVSPYFLTLYIIRRDLQTAFPAIDGPDRDAFREWVRMSGVRENPSGAWPLPADERRT